MRTNGWCPCLMSSKETKYEAVVSTKSLGFGTLIFVYLMSRSAQLDRAESDRRGGLGASAFGGRSKVWLSGRERAQTRCRGR
jgi:hypothetical protein